MRLIRKTSLLVMVTVILMGVCGCMNEKKTYSVEEITDIYDRKYEDKFTFVSMGDELWTADYSEIILCSQKLDGERIVVRVYGDGTMLDNYMAVKYKAEVESLIQPIAETIYSVCKVVNIPIHYGKKHFSKEMTLVEYVSAKTSAISIAIATTASLDDWESDARALVQMLEENHIAANVRIFYYDEENWENVHESELTSKIFTPEAEKRLLIRVSDDYTIDRLEWSN